MTYSQIKVTFNEDLVIGSFLTIEATITPPLSLNSYEERWVNLRSLPNQVTTGVVSDVVGERAAINFMTSFGLDYNGTSQFLISRITNEVTIKSLDHRLTFLGGEAFLTEEGTEADVDFDISNFSGIAFDFVDVSISQADSSPCLNVKVNVETSVLSTEIISPVVVNPNTDNPLSFEWIRGQTILLKVKDADGNELSQNILLPSVLSASNFTLAADSSPNGGTMVVTNVNTQGLNLEYSLDNDVWQSSNVFSGLVPDNYTLYVRDQYGCSFQIDFTIDENGINSPFFYISKSNSIRWAQRVSWGNSSNYKNDENTLSSEVDVKCPYKETQLFQTADIITTQFKSNYDVNEVKILRAPDLMIPTQATSNIMLYSGDLSNSAWVKNHLILSADKVIPDATYNYHSFNQEVDKGALAGDYTFSFYVKPDELKIIDIFIDEVGGAGLVSVGFDSLAKTFFYNYGLNGFTYISSSYTEESNGYLRVALKMGLNTATTINIGMQIRGLSGSPDHTGDGFSGMFFDKFQLQEGDLTSYLQTTNSPESTPASDGSTSVPVLQKTNNIGIKDKRDALKYNLGNGQTGIYFVTGNIYDYDTGSITGTHSLNKTLPEWGLFGNYINLSGTWFLIEAVVYDENKNADVLVINEIYTGAEVSVIVGSVYNIFPYEVYEFSIDMGDYVDEIIKVKIENSSTGFPSLQFLSEDIDVQLRHEDTIEVNYWNSTNNDVFYQTGIRHKIRMPITNAEGLLDEESNIHKTDSNVILLASEMYKGKKFIFEPVTEAIWEKTAMALSHNTVYMDGVKYVKSGDFETEGPLVDSNLYVLKATMLKAGNPYNADGTVFGLNGSNSVEVPGLLQGDNGFIKY